MRLRLRSSSGTSVIKGCDESTPLQELRDKVHAATSIPVAGMCIKFGFPPKAIPASQDGAQAISSLGIKDADTITAEGEAPSREAPAPTPSAPAPEFKSKRQLGPFVARDVPTSSPAGPPSAEVGVDLPDGTRVVKRVVASDNSCLFNSVGYATSRSRGGASKLREVVAATVAGDKETYSEPFLGRGNAEYCKWILDPLHWGGAIELAILSAHFGIQIGAVDIQTNRLDVYGSDCADRRERCYVIYDGLHYDAVAQAAARGAPEGFDQTKFTVGSAELESVERGVKRLAEQLHKQRQFTDTANFALRCGVCQVGLKGEKEAQEHAKQTGHCNFQEY